MGLKQRIQHFGLVLLLALFSSSAQGVEFIPFKLGALGEIYAPSNWIMVKLSNQHVYLKSSDSTTCAEFSLFPSKPADYTRQKVAKYARELGLPPIVRLIDSKILEKAGVDEGFFILGTVSEAQSDRNDSLFTLPIRFPHDSSSPLGEDSLATVTDAEKQWLSEKKPITRYWMVIYYRKHGKVFRLSGFSVDLPAGPDALFRIHQSWVVK